jgi:hypothetical protein
MIEVLKTDVANETDAANLLIKLQQAFVGCRFNFDIDDCDHILRVNASRDMPDIRAVINLILAEGFNADVLPDVIVGEKATISFQSYRHNENLHASIKKQPG